ncbi:hypothetical protein LMG1866_04618 [Achromobacter ruhlandii]|uniref:hypothetical protein n=1 Tax=Achromobacter ruhlandii TaxID=72557 RepID=UPI001465B990|nr:hypothetical protein [Achromobacter ruhlandii]CAB3730750.1 hypothetical protein LMG1866_04618 [Achromobacter ruhlandii]
MHFYWSQAGRPAGELKQAQLRNTVAKTLDACQAALELAGARCAVMPEGVSAPWENSDLVHTLLVAADEDELVRSMDGLTVAIEYLASEPGRLCLEAIRQERAAFENAAGIDPQLRPIKET